MKRVIIKASLVRCRANCCLSDISHDDAQHLSVRDAPQPYQKKIKYSRSPWHLLARSRDGSSGPSNTLRKHVLWLCDLHSCKMLFNYNIATETFRDG